MQGLKVWRGRIVYTENERTLTHINFRLLRRVLRKNALILRLAILPFEEPKQMHRPRKVPAPNGNRDRKWLCNINDLYLRGVLLYNSLISYTHFNYNRFIYMYTKTTLIICNVYFVNLLQTKK